MLRAFLKRLDSYRNNHVLHPKWLQLLSEHEPNKQDEIISLVQSDLKLTMDGVNLP